MSDALNIIARIEKILEFSLILPQFVHHVPLIYPRGENQHCFGLQFPGLVWPAMK